MGGEVKPSGRLTLRAYPIVARAVEEGVAYGYRRAHKYTDSPSEEGLCEAIVSAVMGELCGVLDFEGGGK